MNITQLALGAYQTNCYIVSDGDDCVVIDPGYEEPALFQALDGLQPRAVLLTHGHFDHVGGVAALRALGAEIWMHAADLSLPRPLCPLPAEESYHFLSDGDSISFGSLRFTVLHTPGHTPGSCCFLSEGVLFSGDTLFAGSCGRTDLGGDFHAILASLTRLSGLDEDCRVLPGHGAETSLARERRCNPYMERSVAE